MTQMNNLWVTFDSGAATADTTLYARQAENTQIRVTQDAGSPGTQTAGTTGGSTYTYGSNNQTITLYRGSRYRFLGDSANAVTKSVAGGRFYLATSTSWDSSNFTDEYTTGVLNSRNTLDGDSTLDSTVD